MATNPPPERAFGTDLPESLVARFDRKTRDLATPKKRALAAAVLLFTDLPDDLASDLVRATVQHYWPSPGAPDAAASPLPADLRGRALAAVLERLPAPCSADVQAEVQGVLARARQRHAIPGAAPAGPRRSGRKRSA